MIPAMDVSDAGVAAIVGREGCRLLAYQDQRGVWTIGVGHTAAAGPPAPWAGLEITSERCAEILKADLGETIACVNRVIRVSLEQAEFDALISLAFNIGPNGFAGSHVASLLNAGDVQGAADAFLMWDHPASLLGRRKSERLQFLSGGMSARASAPTPVIFAAGTTRWLQWSLNTLGQTPALGVDGIYGDAVRAAVSAFQAAHGLKVDGLAGAQTDAAIERLLEAR